MIKEATGNLLEADVEALVNTVNCVGFMGKGIALQFKRAYPDNFRAYERACKRGEVQPGRMFVVETQSSRGPRYIINFPTKRHWRARSRMEDIDAGLVALVQEVRSRGIKSLAIPPLGCGHGGLAWDDVRPRIISALTAIPDVRVLLFEPVAASPETRPQGSSERPRMTGARAMFIKLIEQYVELAYRLSLLEIQKLAYFLQEAGEPLALRYEPGHYGPYAHNLNKVLDRIEGHFIRGYGESNKPDVEIELLPHAVEEADQFLGDHAQARRRLTRVGSLIGGFETPYGMELLATTHWVAVHGSKLALTADEAVLAIQAWSERKRAMFSPEHVHVAWTRLADEGWLPRA